MKGCKLKVQDVPNARALWLCRIVHQNTNVSDRKIEQGRRSFGFNKMAMKMSRLGYLPKYSQYGGCYSWLDGV